MSENTELKPLIVPKGTRITIAGYPFYPKNDIDLGLGDDFTQEVLTLAIYTQNNWHTDMSLRVGNNAN